MSNPHRQVNTEEADLSGAFGELNVLFQPLGMFCLSYLIVNEM